MNRINLIILSMAFLLTVSQAQAGEVNNIHTFTSGQPALASEVNTNFSLVEAAVNDNFTLISNLEASSGLGTDSVTTDNITDGAVTSAKLSADVATMLPCNPPYLPCSQAWHRREQQLPAFNLTWRRRTVRYQRCKRIYLPRIAPYQLCSQI